MGFSEEKRKLFEALLREQGLGREDGDRIKRRPSAARAPLSFAQERVWLLDQLLPGSSAYNIPAVVRLRGPLNVAALRDSLTEITRRHETLRTGFVKTDEGPIAMISPAPSVSFEFRDLSIFPETDREREALAIANEEAQAPFDLSKAPLCRTTLIRIGEEDHFFVLTFHHIVGEAWSIAILFRELETLYAALLKGQPSPLRELDIQYGDFAVWQRQRFGGEALKEDIAYWKNQLQDRPVTQLPTDYPRPAMPTFRGAWRSADFSSDITAGLKALAQSEGATFFMILIAAYATLLYRYTGQNDVVIGTPIAGRNTSETENLIGFFVNTLALRIRIPEEATFREFLREVRDVAFDAYAHQDLPFQKLVEEISPDRDIMSHTAVFQVMFGLQNTPIALHLAGMQPAAPLSPSEVHDGGAATDLALVVEEHGESLNAGFEYSTDLFCEATIDRMLRHLKTLLHSIVADPHQKISALTLLSEFDRRQLLIDWNDTTTTYPNRQRVDEMFRLQAERSPGSVAVIDQDDEITYRELDHRSNQLAHFLKHRGVQPGMLVGICVNRSIDMVVGLLAILKAGGAYVPLDPEYPQSRLAVMLEEARVSIVVTQQELRDTWDEAPLGLIGIDSDWPVISREPVTAPETAGSAEDLAYVIFTSGSTGRPKGIGIPHRAINRLVFNTNYVDLGPSCRIAQLSNTSFDASTFEIWGALLHGGRLFIISKDISITPARLVEALRSHQITTMFLTTALFNQTAREVPAAFATLDDVMFGGELVDPRWVRSVLQNGAPKRLLHVYGPTESTTFATFYPIKQVSENDRTIPIGKALSNTTLYVVDRNLQLVPAGVPGELCIGGDGLATGYLNDPELTAKKFVRSPFSSDPGAMLYRTGDLVRWTADGDIEFMERIDHQVKIRGFRIELGEVEVVLRQHPAVRDCAVIVREDVPGDKRLVAYVVTGDEQPVTDALRRFVHERLPEFMVPAFIVRMEALPLNPNGKVDHKALPAPSGARPELEATYVVARTDIEQHITTVWEEVLRLNKVGVNDNFFDLGGNSLLVAQVHNRLCKVMDKPLSMLDLFKYPTVRTLANFIGSSPNLAQSSNDGTGRAKTRRQLVHAHKKHRSARAAGDDGAKRD
jgi:amino acid adenylation domain-containing protein